MDRVRAQFSPLPLPPPLPHDSRSPERPASFCRRQPMSRRRTGHIAGYSAGRSTRASSPSTAGAGLDRSRRDLYPLDFLKTECATEVELHIERRTRVVGKLLLRVLVELQSVLGQAETAVPIHSLLLPVLEPLYVGARLHEELHLHLLELARTENEVAGRNLIPERLADLRD